jgi:hypothetical protein
MKCKDCKHYVQNEYHEHLGECKIELPSWLHSATRLSQYESRATHIDDSCDLGVE